jgi:hypothetical protein
MEEEKKAEFLPMTEMRINMACKREVSFATLAKSSASRSAIVAGSGIASAARAGALLKAAAVLGFTGIITI